MMNRNAEDQRSSHKRGDSWIKLWRMNWIPTGKEGRQALQVKEIELLKTLRCKNPQYVEAGRPISRILPVPKWEIMKAWIISVLVEYLRDAKTVKSVLIMIDLLRKMKEGSRVIRSLLVLCRGRFSSIQWSNKFQLWPVTSQRNLDTPANFWERRLRGVQFCKLVSDPEKSHLNLMRQNLYCWGARHFLLPF